MNKILSNIDFNLDLNDSLKVNNSLISKINDISLELFQTNIDKNRIKILIKEIKEFSMGIFTDLKAQCKDNQAKIFFNELNNEINDYLDNLEDYLLSRKLNLYNSNKSRLNKHGFYFGHLNKNTVEEILNISDKSIKKFEERAKNNQTSRESLSANTGKDIKKIAQLLNKDFKSQGILEDVSNYIGKDYLVSGVALELSVPKSTWWKKKENTKKIPKTLYAHVDESLIHPKSICYLSDVELDNGPTSIFPNIYSSLKLNFLQDIIGRIVENVGSSPNSDLNKLYNNNVEQKFQCKIFKSHFLKLPLSLRFYSHFGWYVEPESKLEDEMVNSETKILGKKGKLVVFDGAKVLHRGGLIEDGNRLALQIVFGPRINFIGRAFNKLKKKVPLFKS
jgi:hypothetical protein